MLSILRMCQLRYDWQWRPTKCQAKTPESVDSVFVCVRISNNAANASNSLPVAAKCSYCHCCPLLLLVVVIIVVIALLSVLFAVVAACSLGALLINWKHLPAICHMKAMYQSSTHAHTYIYIYIYSLSGNIHILVCVYIHIKLHYLFALQLLSD